MTLHPDDLPAVEEDDQGGGLEKRFIVALPDKLTGRGTPISFPDYDSCQKIGGIIATDPNQAIVNYLRREKVAKNPGAVLALLEGMAGKGKSVEKYAFEVPKGLEVQEVDLKRFHGVSLESDSSLRVRKVYHEPREPDVGERRQAEEVFVADWLISMYGIDKGKDELFYLQQAKRALEGCDKALVS